ncbi:hypothetical protein BAE44_0001138, partial [Dichanthelium oligosanthes]
MPRHGKPESMLPFDGNLSSSLALPAVQMRSQAEPRPLSLSLPPSRRKVKHTPTTAFPEVSHCVEACMATRGKVPAP